MKSVWHFQLKITSIMQDREAEDLLFDDIDGTKPDLQWPCSATHCDCPGFNNILFCLSSAFLVRKSHWASRKTSADKSFCWQNYSRRKTFSFPFLFQKPEVYVLGVTSQAQQPYIIDSKLPQHQGGERWQSFCTFEVSGSSRISFRGILSDGFKQKEVPLRSSSIYYGMPSVALLLCSLP